MIKFLSKSKQKLPSDENSSSRKNLSNTITSFGNPVIGYRLKEHYFRFLGITEYGERENIYFEEFMETFLNQKVGGFAYDTPPLNQVYSHLLDLESHSLTGIRTAKNNLSVAKRDPVSVEADIEELGFALIQEEYGHATIKNAIKTLEGKFPYLSEITLENRS
jgi:hypothetical protein